MKLKNIYQLAMLAWAILGAASPVMALTIDKQFDGQWYEANKDARRGWSLEYLERGPESGVLYIVGYIYDDAGNPFWANGAGEVVAGDFRVHVQLELVEGGCIGPEECDPQTTDPNWGIMDINFHDCNDATFTWSTPLGDGTSEYQSILKVVNEEGSTTARCVYQKPFNACPSFSTPAAEPRTCILSGTYTQDIHLTNNTTWVLSGGVFIGAKDATNNNNTMYVDAGTRIVGSGGIDLLIISRGSRIVAEGQPYAPIVFTGPKTVPEGASSGDWGGLVVNGFAPINTCDTQPCTAVGEGDSGTYGGGNPNDSSGVLRYVRVQFAGIKFTDVNELNGIAFQGVGNGTVVDYVQVHRNADDGIEFFGGTVNVRHVVVTEAEDDSLDWTQGYSGNIQYGIVIQSTDQTIETDTGMEMDNLELNNDAVPRSQPKVANITLIGREGELGMNIRRGTGGNFSNLILTDFTTCIKTNSPATYTAAGTPDALTGVLTMENTLINCPNSFTQDADAPWTTEAWFNAQPGNAEQDPMLTGIYPPNNADYLSGYNLDPAVFGEFFDHVDWIGAVRNEETASAWQYNWSIFVDN